MKPIPKAAMSVVEVLRRDVPKPESLLFLGLYCPMGLHPESLSISPTSSFEFAGGECSNPAVRIFGRWWDSLKAADAREAVDAIWGK